MNHLPVLKNITFQDGCILFRYMETRNKHHMAAVVHIGELYTWIKRQSPFQLIYTPLDIVIKMKTWQKWVSISFNSVVFLTLKYSKCFLKIFPIKLGALDSTEKLTSISSIHAPSLCNRTENSFPSSKKYENHWCSLNNSDPICKIDHQCAYTRKWKSAYARKSKCKRALMI